MPAYGAPALGDFIFSGAYNKVSGSGSVSNGFGGGPFFSSSEHNTIDGTPRIRAIAAGVEYTGIDRLTLGVRRVNFNQGVGDELDTFASYSFSEDINLDMVYSDMGPDGSNVRAFLNYHIDLL